ncbi:hypothetical protein DD880_13450, partial [Staphylococcus pseudintermedius]
VGYNPNINKYSALFLVTILDLEREKYSFGRKYRTRIPKTKIKLPVKKNQRGEYIKDKNNRYIPDWEYMEEFIK